MKVKILGEEIEIKFNMAVELAYEKISGEPFSFDAMSRTENTLALDMAAIMIAAPDTAITMDALLKDAKGYEIAALNKAVVDEMTEWLAIPKVVADAEAKEPQPDVNEPQPKN